MDPFTWNMITYVFFVGLLLIAGGEYHWRVKKKVVNRTVLFSTGIAAIVVSLMTDLYLYANNIQLNLENYWIENRFTEISILVILSAMISSYYFAGRSGKRRA